jgi:hypothetical protein
MLINGVMPEIEGLVNGEIYNSDGVQVRVHIVPRLDSCSSLTGPIRGVRWMRGNEGSRLSVHRCFGESRTLLFHSELQFARPGGNYPLICGLPTC